MPPVRELSIAAALAISVAVPTAMAQTGPAAVRRDAERIGTSADGGNIVARHRWSAGADTRVLVIGSVRARDRRAEAVVHRLRELAIPASLDLWTIRTIHPDARGRATKRETRALHRFVRRVQPRAVVVLEAGRRAKVSAPRGSAGFGRALADAADVRFDLASCGVRCQDPLTRRLDARPGTRAVTFQVTPSASPRRLTAAARAVLRVTTRIAPATSSGRKKGGPRSSPSPTASASPSPTAAATSSPTASPTTASTSTTSTTSSAPIPASSPAPAPAGGPFVAYSSGSFFRSPVAGLGVDAAATESFRAFMKSHPDQKDTPYPMIRGVGGNAWGTAYAQGSATDPVWRLTGSVPSAVSVLATQGFHAPEWFGAMLTGTSDSPFVVVDRGTGWSVWGAKSKVVGDHLIQVGAAGLFQHASNGLDKRNPRSDSSLNFRSRGAIPDAMVIRRDLVDWGVAHGTDLGHVLHLFMVETDSAAGFVHPMVGAESGKYGWGAEGQRIAIDPRVDLTTRGLSPEALVIARTLQRYGAYIGDNAGGPSSLKAEQENSVRNVWGGRLRADSLRGITWDDFVVIAGG